MRKPLLALAAALLLSLAPLALHAAPAPAACQQHAPFGTPDVIGPADLTVLCRNGYVLAHDNQRLEPRWVAFRLTRDVADGCGARHDAFAPDPDLPRGRRAELADYLGSGYDRGHMAPDGDFRGQAEAERESFFLSNMVPQLHALNAGLWARLEAHERAWAAERGSLLIITGPLYDPQPAALHGPNHLPIPSGFWRVLMDERTHETLSFVVPQRALLATDALEPFVVPDTAVELAAGIRLPVPPGLVPPPSPFIWPDALRNFAQAKESACARH